MKFLSTNSSPVLRLKKMASILILEYLKTQAAKGDRSEFEYYLAAVPDVPA